MNYQIVKIQVEPEELLPAHTDILLSLPLATKYNLTPGQTLTISYGMTKVKGRYLPTSQTFPFIRVKESIAKKLVLPDSFFEVCCLFIKEERTLKIGPLTAILAREPSETNIEKEMPFGDLTSFFKEILQSAREKHGIAYILTLDQIGEDGPVLGWFYKNGVWQKKFFPLPTCIYNRIASRKLERQEDTKEKLAWIKNKGIAFFNEGFLDKWSIHQGLRQDPEIKKLLPDTVRYINSDSLRMFLQKYPYLYLKPTHGSLGSGIIRIFKEKDYRCQFSSMNGMITQYFSTFEKLFDRLRGRLNKRAYLLQQGLHLITMNNQILDFRALVQRNYLGEWHITSIVARVSNHNNIVSNVARGGAIYPLTEALSSADYSFPVEITKNAIREAALKVAKSMEQYIPGEFAELGIDLALDQKGDLWLIEVNSKPSKNDTSLSRGPTDNKIRRSVVKLMDYCFFRSGFIQSFHQSTRRRSNKG